MQACEQTEGDGLADPALVLLSLPIEVEGADGGELGEHGSHDDDVEEMPEIDPYSDENGEVRDLEGGLDVVEGFG